MNLVQVTRYAVFKIFNNRIPVVSLESYITGLPFVNEWFIHVIYTNIPKESNNIYTFSKE